MTERLYYDNAYLLRFDAVVEECIPKDGAWLVRLNRSAFYPTSGGQPFDTGTLGMAKVQDVNVDNGEVWHTVDAPLQAGETVTGEIDWPRRFDHMQQHAADHMIAGTIWRLLGGVTIGLHTGEDVSTIDVAMPEGVTRISSEDIRRVENEVNERIQRDVPIRCWFPSEAELETLPLRKKPTVSEHIRVVAIGDDEMVACGGTHPSTAGQVGLVKIVSVTPARGKMRVAFLAGQRALKDYFKCYEAAHASAELFSSTVDRLASFVAATQERLREAEAELNRIHRDRLLERIPRMTDEAEVLSSGAKLVTGMVEADAASLRELASKLIEQPGVIALLGTMTGEQAMYVFGRSTDVSVDVGKLLREAARISGGKGGGKPDFAQGGGPAALLEAACAMLKGNA